MIDATGLIKRYGAKTAVDGVSLAIKPGEVFGLLGENGAGKTSLIRLFSTLSHPDGGSCRVGGFDTIAEPMGVKRLIGVVFQENNLDRDLSAQANLMFHARLHRLDRAGPAVDAMLERLGLASRATDPVDSLSGGMRRRLVIGRALLTRPRVLFLDEPTTGLDPAIRRDIWALVGEIRAEGCTVVLTTHYVEEAEALCDRVAIMAKGRLVAMGSPAELAGGGKLEDKVVLLGSGRHS